MGSVQGVVQVEPARPVPGVEVCLASTRRCAVTGDAGTFRITEVRSGEYRLSINLPGTPAFTTDTISVRAGSESRIEVALPALGEVKQSVTVSASISAIPDEVKTSSYQIQPRELLKAAGGDQDISRYVQSLPGAVFGSDDFRNDIVVRGGSPLENLFIVDNIEIPNINSFATLTSAGGTVSLLDANLISDVTFLTGGFPAPYTNRLSGVLQVTQREGDRAHQRARITLGAAGLGGIVEGPVAKGKGSWVVSARRSFLDAFTDDIGFGGVPVNYSFNAKAVYDLNAANRIWIADVSGVDRISIQPDGVSKDQQVNTTNVKNDGWRSSTGLNWQHLFGARGVGLLGLAHSASAVNTRLGDQLRNDLTIYQENNREGESTVKYDLTAYVPFFEKVQAGGNFKIFQIDYRTAQPFGFDDPYSRLPAVNPFFVQKQDTAYQPSAYFQSSMNLTTRLNLTWGGRFDRYQYIRASRFSPRAGVRFRITKKLSWRASYGTYYQQPTFLFLSVFPVNRGLSPIRGDHVVAGFSYVVNPTLRITLEGYRKTYSAYPVALAYPSLSLANIGDTFDTRGVLLPLTSAGRGYARGVELFLEKKFSRKFFGQTNLSWSRARQAGLDGILRPGSYDSPIVFNAVGGYQINRKWEVSGRVVYLTGRPYTPFDLAASTAQNRAVFDTPRVNGVRAPDYSRVDLRVDRTFTVRDKPLTVFVGLQNAFNRDNFQELDWNRRANRPKIQSQLSLFPLIGIDWRL